MRDSTDQFFDHLKMSDEYFNENRSLNDGFNLSDQKINI